VKNELRIKSTDWKTSVVFHGECVLPRFRQIKQHKYSKLSSDLTNQIVRRVMWWNGASLPCPIFPQNDTSQKSCFCTEYLKAHYQDELLNRRWDNSYIMQLNVKLCSHLYGVLDDGVHSMVLHSRMPSGYHNQHQPGIHRVRQGH
jgi:hypothetical protein